MRPRAVGRSVCGFWLICLILLATVPSAPSAVGDAVRPQESDAIAASPGGNSPEAEAGSQHAAAVDPVASHGSEPQCPENVFLPAPLAAEDAADPSVQVESASASALAAVGARQQPPDPLPPAVLPAPPTVGEGAARNFALDRDGAKVLAANPEARKPAAVLDDDGDTYIKNDCKADKWLVIELAQVAKVTRVELSQFELYSSKAKEFVVYGRQSQPRAGGTDVAQLLNSTQWRLLGSFAAEKTKGTQAFAVQHPAWVRYLLFRFLTHHGTEPVCALNGIAVYGKSAAEELEDHLADDHEEMQAPAAEAQAPPHEAPAPEAVVAASATSQAGAGGGADGGDAWASTQGPGGVAAGEEGQAGEAAGVQPAGPLPIPGPGPGRADLPGGEELGVATERGQQGGGANDPGAGQATASAPGQGAGSPGGTASQARGTAEAAAGAAAGEAGAPANATGVADQGGALNGAAAAAAASQSAHNASTGAAADAAGAAAASAADAGEHLGEAASRAGLEALSELLSGMRASAKKPKAGTSVYDILLQELKAAQLAEKVLTRTVVELQRNLSALAGELGAGLAGLRAQMLEAQHEAPAQVGDELAAQVDSLAKATLSFLSHDMLALRLVVESMQRQDQALLSYAAAAGGLLVLATSKVGDRWPWVRLLIGAIAATNGLAGTLLLLHGPRQVGHVAGILQALPPGA